MGLDKWKGKCVLNNVAREGERREEERREENCLDIGWSVWQGESRRR